MCEEGQRQADSHSHTHTHTQALLQTEVLSSDCDATQCFNFIVAEEATARLSSNINMNSAGFYKDKFQVIDKKMSEKQSYLLTCSE